MTREPSASIKAAPPMSCLYIRNKEALGARRTDERERHSHSTFHTFFISLIPAAVLMSRPPESKQTPFPTRQSSGSFASSAESAATGDHLRSMRAGGRLLARPTVWMAGKFWKQKEANHGHQHCRHSIRSSTPMYFSPLHIDGHLR